MKITSGLALAVFWISGAVLSAQPAGERHEEKGRSGEPFELQKKASKKSATSSASANNSAEIFQNVVIPAGKSVSLDSSLDYSYAGVVAVTVYCPTCTTQATAMNGLVLQAFWSLPEADWFAVAETKAASSFPYWDSGGAIFQVYGPQFRLTLQNKGSQSLLVPQVTIFARVL